ncbi:Uncharacterised protein [Burkholderia pseudomallei]|nr:Uncharacterised protein [Burkholderia pseudomallei]CAK1338588.1 Uncharacterised protein [Burkholderia pseudomallei]
MTVHGADAVQALELAVQDMEHYLRRLSKKYDFYFDDGTPYFEDEGMANVRGAQPRTIATRKLAYTVKGESGRTLLTVCIGEPFLLTEDNCDIAFGEDAAGCVVSFEGLQEKAHTVIGGDTFQALELAVGAAESSLRRLSKKYDFYFDDDDPYFEG